MKILKQSVRSGLTGLGILVMVLTLSLAAFSVPSYAAAESTAVVTTGGINLNIRSGPSTQNVIIATVPTGTSVTVKSAAGNGWYIIEYTSGKVGYVYGKYLQFSSSTGSTSSAAYPVTAKVTNGGVPLKLRKSASTGSAILAEIPRGSSITITGKYSSSWYKASYNGKNGYVYASYITMPSAGSSGTTSGTAGSITNNTSSSAGTTSGSTSSVTYPVTASVTKGSVALKLRQKASTASAILAEIPRGSSITITDKYNSSWYKAFYNGKSGYVYASYIIIPSASSGSGSSNSNSSPSTGSSGSTTKYTYTKICLDVINYSQFDSRWSNTKLGTSGYMIKQCGCVVCGLAQIETYKQGKSITPNIMVKSLTFDAGGNLYWPYGYYAEWPSSYTAYMQAIYKQLKNNNPVLLGGYTSAGKQHWIVVTGYNANGNTLKASNFIINDCSGRFDTLAEYTAVYSDLKKIVYKK